METQVLKLYVAGHGPNASFAKANIEAFCRDHLGEVSLDVIDVLKEPEKALAEGILVTPLLIRTSPKPVVMVIGNFSHLGTLLAAFGLGAKL
ncbi:MAG: circadian clock KaiB family protein [Verrucomicrobiales bacterium]